MLGMTLIVLALLIGVWALCRILRFLLCAAISVTSAIACVVLIAIAVFGLIVVLALRAFLP